MGGTLIWFDLVGFGLISVLLGFARRKVQREEGKTEYVCISGSGKECRLIRQRDRSIRHMALNYPSILVSTLSIGGFSESRRST